MELKFYETAEDMLLKFAVIISRSKDKWVLCKHKERDTYEIPGGHREEDETIYQTAVRELKEETGAVDFTLRPLCVYSVTGWKNINKDGSETFGMLWYAEINSFEEIHSEIEYIRFFDTLPDNWTYPDTHPKIIEYATEKYGL